MENCIIYPPNRPLERIMRPSQAPVLYSHMLYIDANDKGEIILGCSNLSGTYWEGTLFHYKDVVMAKTHSFTGYFICDSTTTDAKFLKSNLVLLAEDSGAVKLLSILNGEKKQGIVCEDLYQKGYRVEQMAVWDIGKAVMGYEKSLVLYDILNGSSIQLSQVYEYFHTERITSVDTHKSNVEMFASTSVDRRACIWDSRMSVPATVLYRNEFCSLTSVSWDPVNTDTIAVGSEAGDVYLLDIKQPKEFLSVTHCFDSNVYRLLFNDFGNIALCGDNSSVMIYKTKNHELEKIYENNEHSGFVRGLTWHKNDLYSCAFDKKIMVHTY